MFVKPTPDPERPGQLLKVRQPRPSFALLPDGGAEVPDNHFWRRRIAQGDVVLVESKGDDE